MNGKAVAHLDGFLNALGAAGIEVTLLRRMDFFKALTALDLISTKDVYWAGRVMIVSRFEQISGYNATFDAWFRGADATQPELPPESEEAASEEPPEGNDNDARPPEAGGEGKGLEANADELLLRRQAEPTPPEKRDICKRITRTANAVLPKRRSRRARPSTRPGALDLRKTIAVMRRSGGDAAELAFRERPMQPRPVVMLIDISGSLKTTSTDALRAAHALVASDAAVEVFTFGTRLTRVTQALSAADVDTALSDLADIIFDFDGGTRIGTSFETFLDNSRLHSLVRGAVVFVVSDGLERGDVTAMAEATAHLGRLSHRLVWLTPLMGDIHYRPVTRGMQAVLPELDRLGDASTLTSFLHELEVFDRQVESRSRRMVALDWRIRDRAQRGTAPQLRRAQ